MTTITKLRDRNGAFHGSYLGSDGRYYSEDELYNQEGESLFDFTVVEQSVEEVPAIAAEAAQVDADNALADLRRERNKKIAETDWWALPDSPTMTAEQTTYRQALRDITDTYSSLDDVVWPTQP